MSTFTFHGVVKQEVEPDKWDLMVLMEQAHPRDARLNRFFVADQAYVTDRVERLVSGANVPAVLGVRQSYHDADAALKKEQGQVNAGIKDVAGHKTVAETVRDAALFMKKNDFVRRGKETSPALSSSPQSIFDMPCVRPHPSREHKFPASTPH